MASNDAVYALWLEIQTTSLFLTRLVMYMTFSFVFGMVFAYFRFPCHFCINSNRHTEKVDMKRLREDNEVLKFEVRHLKRNEKVHFKNENDMMDLRDTLAEKNQQLEASADRAWAKVASLTRSVESGVATQLEYSKLAAAKEAEVCAVKSKLVALRKELDAEKLLTGELRREKSSWSTNFDVNAAVQNAEAAESKYKQLASEVEGRIQEVEALALKRVKSIKRKAAEKIKAAEAEGKQSSAALVEDLQVKIGKLEAAEKTQHSEAALVVKKLRSELQTASDKTAAALANQAQSAEEDARARCDALKQMAETLFSSRMAEYRAETEATIAGAENKHREIVSALQKQLDDAREEVKMCKGELMDNNENIEKANQSTQEQTQRVQEKDRQITKQSKEIEEKTLIIQLQDNQIQQQGTEIAELSQKCRSLLQSEEMLSATLQVDEREMQRMRELIKENGFVDEDDFFGDDYVPRENNNGKRLNSSKNEAPTRKRAQRDQCVQENQNVEKDENTNDSESMDEDLKNELNQLTDGADMDEGQES